MKMVLLPIYLTQLALLRVSLQALLVLAALEQFSLIFSELQTDQHRAVVSDVSFYLIDVLLSLLYRLRYLNPQYLFLLQIAFFVEVQRKDLHHL